jgi:ABC-type transport system involved in multi-copper enzyme maturation permease subunit
MKTLYANIEDVMREAAARWTLVAYFFLSTVFILIFASAINLDIVDGALAGAKLFGKDLHAHTDAPSLEKAVNVFEGGFSFILYYFCTFLAIFATAHLVPRMQEKGTVDLYLSRPVSRTGLILSRYLAGLLLAGSNVVYLLGSVSLIVLWKTHVFHPRFVFAGGIILLIIATLLAFAFLIGVVTSSTAVSIMTTYAFFFFSIMMMAHERFEALMAHDWQASIINAVYWIFPKTGQLGFLVASYVSVELVPARITETLSPSLYYSTAGFGVASLILACWLFQRKEF